MFHEFELGYNAAEATNICWAKGESTVDQSIQMVEEISLKLSKFTLRSVFNKFSDFFCTGI